MDRRHDPDQFFRQGTRPGLRSISGAELMGKSFPPLVFTIPQFVTPGLTLLCGKPKIGKSWLSLDWSLAVAAPHGIAMGTYDDVQHGDVLHLALEDNERRLQRRLRQMLPEQSVPDTLHLATQWSRVGAGGIEAIEQELSFMRHPQLVQIDILERVRGDSSKQYKDNLYRADYEALLPFKELADRHNIAVVVIHHLSKRTRGDDLVDLLSGTTGLAGAADTIVVLYRDQAGTKLYARGRDIEELEIALQFDKTTGCFRALGNADEVLRSEARQKIIAALEPLSTPASPKEIATRAGLSVYAVQSALTRLLLAGEVHKVGFGKYVLALANSGNSGADSGADD